MSDLSFGHAWILPAVVLPLLACAVWALMQRRAVRRASAVSRVPAAAPRYLAAVFFALAACAAVVAAAQPRWGTQPSEISRTGAELMIVLDVSHSMDARDVAPSRLEAAKAAINATLDRLGGDSAALVVFAGSGRLRFPFTSDFTAARQVVSSLETGSVIVKGGTSASLGLDVALSAFDNQPGAGRVILLITDGDDLGADPAEVATRISAAGVNLMVAGVGTATGATVPVYDNRTRSFVDKKAADGTPIVSKLNEPFLRTLAAASGGRYLGSNLSSLPGAVSGRLAAIQHTRFEERPTPIPVERFQWFAGLALGALVIGSVAERLPRPRRRRALLAGLAVGALLLGGCASRAYEVNEDALDAFHRGDTDRAINLFIEAQALRPNDARITLNLAAAYHQGGRYDEAVIAVRRVLASPDPADRNRGYASIGHHEYAAGRLANALDAFKRALIEDPADDVSRRDYELVLREIAPPPPENPAAGPSPTPQAGDGTPTPAPSQQPGQSGTPDPNGTPGAPGTPTAGARPSDAQSLERQIGQIDAQVAALLDEAGENPTAAEALKILQLLAERNRLAAQRDALSGNADPKDY